MIRFGRLSVYCGGSAIYSLCSSTGVIGSFARVVRGMHGSRDSQEIEGKPSIVMDEN